MALKVKFQLVELLAEKSKREGYLFKIADVQQATGISRHRLYLWRDGNLPIIKPEEIQLLCDFFPCEVHELIHYESPLEEGQGYVRAARELVPMVA